VYSPLNALIASNSKNGAKSKVKKPKSTGDLRRSILELAAQENIGVPAERQVTHRMVMTVASRTIEDTKSLPMESRVFAAYKAVGRFISLAINGETENNKAKHKDLLPIGHPCSTRRHGMTASAYRMTSARWHAADPRIDDSVRSVVASAIYYEAGTVEQLHAMKRLEALTAGAVPRDVVLTALTAVGGNSSMAKSIRANLQLRNRDGEWIEMGGGLGFDLTLPDGSIAPVVGKSAGGVIGSPDKVHVVIKDDPNVPDGIYEVPASKVSSVQAILPESAVKGLKTPATKTTAGDKYTVEQSEFVRKTEPDGWDPKPEGSFELANGRAADEVFTSPDGYEVLKWNNVDSKVASHLGNVAKGSKPGETSIPVAGAMPNGKLDPNQPAYLLRRTEGGPGVKKAVGIAQDWADVQKLAGKDQEKYEKDKQSAADAKNNIKKSQEQAAEAKSKLDADIASEKERLNQAVDSAVASRLDIDGNPLPEGWVTKKGQAISQDKNDAPPSKESLLAFEKNQDGVTLTATKNDDGIVSMEGMTYDTFDDADAAAPAVAKDKADARISTVVNSAMDAVRDYDPDGEIAEMIDSGASADEVFAKLNENPKWKNAKEDYDSRGFVDSPSKSQSASWAETGRQVKSIEDLKAGKGRAKRDSLNDIVNSIEENAPYEVKAAIENYQGNEFATITRESDGKQISFGISYGGQPRPGETVESTEYAWNETEGDASGVIPLEIRDADGIAKEFWNQAGGDAEDTTLAKRDSLNDIANSIEENAPFKVKTRMENYQGNEFLTVTRESDGKEILFGLAYAGQPRPGETTESTEYVWNEPEGNASGEIPLDIRDADGIAKEFWKQAGPKKLKKAVDAVKKNILTDGKGKVEWISADELDRIATERAVARGQIGMLPAKRGEYRPVDPSNPDDVAAAEKARKEAPDGPFPLGFVRAEDLSPDGLSSELKGWRVVKEDGKGQSSDLDKLLEGKKFKLLADELDELTYFDQIRDYPFPEGTEIIFTDEAGDLVIYRTPDGTYYAIDDDSANALGDDGTPIPPLDRDYLDQLTAFQKENSKENPDEDVLDELEMYLILAEVDDEDGGDIDVRDRIKKESEKLRGRAADLALEIDNQKTDQPNFFLDKGKEFVTDALNTLDKVSRGQTDEVINDGLIFANMRLMAAERFLRDGKEDALADKVKSLKIEVNDLWKSGRKSDGDDPDMDGVEGPDEDLNYKYRDVVLTKDLDGLWKIGKPLKPSGLTYIMSNENPASLKEVKELIDKRYVEQGKPSSSAQKASKAKAINSIEDLADAYGAKLLNSPMGKSFDAGDYGVGENADGTYDVIGPKLEEIATNVESASEVKKIIDEHAAANGLSTSSESGDSGAGDNSGNAGGDTGQGDSSDEDEVAQTNELDFEPDVPENGYKMNLTTFLPEGPEADMAPDYTEDPAVLANKFSEETLKDALVEGLVGVKDAGSQLLEDLLGTPDDDEEEAPVKKKPGPKKKGPKKEVKGSGSAPLTFGEGEEEYVPVEAVFLALREKGVDADALVAEIYDTYSPKDEDGNSTTNNVAALAQARGQGTTSVTALDVTTSRDDSQAPEIYPASKPLTKIITDLANREEPNQKLIDMAEQVRAFADSPNLDDELYVELLNRNMELAFSDDENDKEAFAALWGMLLFLDGGDTNYETYYVDGGLPDSWLGNSVATALEKYTGSDAPNQYMEFFDKFGMFSDGDNKDFYTSRIRIADGSEDPMDSDSAAGPFYRMLAQFKDESHVELYRGISVNSDDPILAKIQTVGAVLDIDGRSFSADKIVAGQSSGIFSEDNNKTSVIFTLPEGKAMSLDVSKISMFQNEKERIVAGRFRIVGVTAGVTPKGRVKYNVAIEPIEEADEESTSSELRDLIENEIFEMPEGYYDIDPSPYKMFDEMGPGVPEGYTDDPAYIAENWDADDLGEVFVEAIRDGSGLGRLTYPLDGGFEANVTAEALRDALQLQGVDTNVLLQELSSEMPDAPGDSEESNISDYIIDLTSEMNEQYDISDWKKIGAAAGSNEGGFYESPDGDKFYVKFPKSALHAANEILAAALYLGLGIDVPMVMQGLGADGELVTLTELIDDAKSNLESKLEDPEYKKKVQQGFAIDAWLANWDVAGLVYDNIMTNADGDPVRVDPGGALLFRAMGSPKGGLFGNEVNELDTLRDEKMNPTSASIFGSMTDEEITESASLLLNITEDEVDALVDAAIADESVAEQLKSTLKARRQYILDRYGINEEESAVEEEEVEEVEEAEPEEKATPSAGDYKLSDGTPINIGDKYRYKKTGEIVEVVKYDPGNTGYVHVLINGKKQNKSTKQLEAIGGGDGGSGGDDGSGGGSGNAPAPEITNNNYPRDEQGEWQSLTDIVTKDSQNVAAVESLANLNQYWKENNYDFDVEEVSEEHQALDKAVPGAKGFSEYWVSSYESAEAYRDEAARGLADGAPIGQSTLAALQLVEGSPLTDAASFRGAAFTQEELARFASKKTIDLPLASFVYSSERALQYSKPAENIDPERDQRVLFELEPNAKAVPVGAIAQEASIGELMTSGRFTVTDVQQKTDADGSNYTSIKLKQLGTFDLSGLKIRGQEVTAGDSTPEIESDVSTPPPPAQKANKNLAVISNIKNTKVQKIAKDLYGLNLLDGWSVKEAGFFSDESGFAFIDPVSNIAYEFLFNDGSGGDNMSISVYAYTKDAGGKEIQFLPKGQKTREIPEGEVNTDFAVQTYISLINDRKSHMDTLGDENKKYDFLEEIDADTVADDSAKKSKIKISVADDAETYEYLFSDTDIDTKLLDAVISEFKDGLGSGEIIAIKEEEDGQSVVYTVDGTKMLEQRLANVENGKPGDWFADINGMYGKAFYDTKEAREIGYRKLTEEQLDYLHAVIELRKPVPLVKTDTVGIDIAAQSEFEELLGENVGIVPELYNAVIAEFKDGLGSGQIIALAINEDGNSQKIVYTLDGDKLYQRTFENGKLEKDPLYLGSPGIEYAKYVFSGDTPAAAEEGFFNPSEEQLDFLHRVIEGKIDEAQESPGGLKGASGETLLVGLVVTDKNGNTGTITKLKPESGYAMVQLADGSKKWRSAKTLSSTGQAAEVMVKPAKPKSAGVPKITPAGAPKVQSQEPVDWNESNFMEVPSLAGAITRVMSDADNAGIAGASAAVDSDSIEDLDLRVMRVKDTDGSDGLMFKFRLTSWAGKAKRDALWKEMEDKTDAELEQAGIRVSKLDVPKILLSANGAQLVEDESGYKSPLGKTVEISLPNDIRIRLNFATGNMSGKYGKPAAFDNTVSIYAPAGTDPKLIEEALVRAGVADARPATDADADILIENRLMSIFDKQTDPKKNLKGEQRQESLKRIFDKYGITAGDVTLTTGANGRIETRISKEGADAILRSTGNPTHLKHDGYMYSHVSPYDSQEVQDEKNSVFADKIVSVLAGPHGALLSTTARWSEGIGAGGQSSHEDVGVGSADYVFMTPRIAKYTDALQPGYEYKGTGVSFYFNAREMYERLDFYANKTDKFGKRVNGHDVLDEASVSASMFANPYEVMFKHRVGFEDLDAVIVNQAVRTMVLQKLSQLGITEIGGKPIEQVVRVGGVLPDIDDL